MIVGMDFGTTNSGMAVYDGRTVRLLPIDESNNNPFVARTSLYVTNDQSVTIGRAAVERYFEHNIGRPVKLQRVWIGELEIFGADMKYVTDAYAYVDVLSPGRLFLSMKTSLRDADYPGTVVGQFYYPLEDLIALYLSVARLRAGRMLGQEVRQVVLGRPVRFAADPEHDSLAQARLLQAAFHAGYEKVYLQHEPVAAAYSYEKSLDRPENVLVFDFGGGTLDITVMRLGEPGKREVLSRGGVTIAGDVFDQKLVRTKLPKHFGEGSFYGDRRKALTVPKWIYDSFSNWQTILDLQSTDNRRLLQDMARTAQRRFQIEALISLVANNHGLQMFDIVEKAKRRLSDSRGAEITLEGPGFSVREFLTRGEFESIIRAETLAIEKHLNETVEASGLPVDEIDTVIRTGGSSQIPVFHEMLQRIFGAEKVRDVNTFSSVTAGLGIIAHGVENGEVELQSYTEQDISLPDVPVSRPNVSPINLDLIQRRVVADETATDTEHIEDRRGIVRIVEDGKVAAAWLPLGDDSAVAQISLKKVGADGTGSQMITAEADEELLLVTTHYRFLLSTPRQLIDLKALGLALTDLHRFERYEKLCAVASWSLLKQHSKMLVVTSIGYTRTYPMNVLQSNVEAPVPMKFDQPLPGDPILIRGVEGEEELVIVTAQGRGIRLPMNRVLTSGLQALNCGRDDRVSAATPTDLGDELLLVTADGYGRRLSLGPIPLAEKANEKGKSLVARQSDLVAAYPISRTEPAWLATTSRLLPVEYDHLPEEDSTRTYRLAKLSTGEEVQSAIRAITVTTELSPS